MARSCCLQHQFLGCSIMDKPGVNTFSMGHAHSSLNHHVFRAKKQGIHLKLVYIPLPSSSRLQVIFLIYMEMRRWSSTKYVTSMLILRSLDWGNMFLTSLHFLFLFSMFSFSTKLRIFLYRLIGHSETRWCINYFDLLCDSLCPH